MTRKRIAAVLLLACCMRLTAKPAYAADPVFRVEGNYDRGSFVLTSSGTLFDEKDMKPGESWSTEIVMANSGSRDMEICVKEILSDSADSQLADLLQLKITDTGGTVIYEGPYGGTTTPVTPMIELASGEEATLKVEVALPGDKAGNAQGGLSLESTWTFEANYQGSSSSGNDNSDDDWDWPEKTEDKKPDVGTKDPVDTGAAILTSNTIPVIYFGICLLASMILLLAVRKRKNQHCNAGGEKKQ